MRIISKFFDYYDKAASFHVDPKLVYVRETKEETYNRIEDIPAWAKSLFGYIPNISYYYNYDYGIIGFCGKVYSFYEVNDIAKSSYVYSFKKLLDKVNGETFEKNVIGNAADKDYAKTYVKRFRDDLKRQTRSWNYLRNHGMDHYCGKSVGDDVFIGAGTPIVLARKKMGAYVVIRNPRLSQYNFIVEVDPVTAWQEIAMYIGNNMAKQVDPNDNITDEMRIDLAGFDKWSFRKQGKK